MFTAGSRAPAQPDDQLRQPCDEQPDLVHRRHHEERLERAESAREQETPERPEVLDDAPESRHVETGGNGRQVYISTLALVCLFWITSICWPIWYVKSRHEINLVLYPS